MAPMLIRPLSRMMSICLNPSPSFPNRLPAGTRQFSNDSAEVTDPESHLGFVLARDKAGVPFSTRKQEIPRVPASRSVLAVQ